MSDVRNPPKVNQEIVAAICEEIAHGASLRKACAWDHHPSKTEFLRWVAADVAVRDQYTRAREAQAEFFADELIEIVDTEDDPAKARVRMDARKWAAGKLAPKKYGDKVSLGGDGEDGAIRVLHTIERRIVRPGDPDC